MGVFIFFILSVTTCVVLSNTKVPPRPNVVFIVADDLGWNDVSFHGSDQILTPNIDLLAYTGVALHRYYSHCICTPSRSAIMTGKFAHKTGMQGYPLTNAEDRGLPVTEKILPQYLKELGYSTHLVGKWHLGHSRYEFLPTLRGYDTFYGHRGGFVDYYEYTAEETWATAKVSGMALFRNLTADWAAEGYVTDLYTAEAKHIIKSHDPSIPLFLTVCHNAPHSGNDGALLQAPPEDVRAMRHVESPERRIYAAMMKNLDDSIGEIVDALRQKKILNNTIIVFISDNGAPTQGLSTNYGSNWPLKGVKMTPWEAGIRVVGLVWSLNMPSSHLWKGYIHAVDWLPTILGAVNATPPEETDGKNLWNNIVENKKSDREDIYEIDDYSKFYSIISGSYKLVIGNVEPRYSVQIGKDLKGIIGTPPSYLDAIRSSRMYSILKVSKKGFDESVISTRDETKIDCSSKEFSTCIPDKDRWCLYNIEEDPCEKEDLSKSFPVIGESLLQKLRFELEKTIPRNIPLYRDPRGTPKLFNYTWEVFMDVAPFSI